MRYTRYTLYPIAKLGATLLDKNPDRFLNSLNWYLSVFKRVPMLIPRNPMLYYGDINSPYYSHEIIGYLKEYKYDEATTMLYGSIETTMDKKIIDILDSITEEEEKYISEYGIFLISERYLETPLDSKLVPTLIQFRLKDGLYKDKDRDNRNYESYIPDL